MANNQKKYASLSTLQTFLDNLKNLFITKTDVNTELAKKSDLSHNHNDKYYQKSEVDSALSGKSDKMHNHDSDYSTKDHNHDGVYALEGHNHDSKYETKSDASTKLTEAKTYADNAANTVKNDLLNNAGAAYDTLKELGDLIDDNTDAIDALETVASGKADKVHKHTVSDITDLTTTATELNYMDGVTSNVQAQLDSKLSASGGTMTGEITLTQSNLVKRDKDTSSVSIYGGTESGNGASVTVYGKEQAIYAGRFALKANNGESSATLEGIPDGTLRWNGKNIVALGTSEVIPISSGGTGAANASDALSNLGGVPKTNPTLTGSFSMNKLYSSTTGSCSFVEGYNGSATGNYGAHSEGYYTEANGDRSHAEGDGSVANGIGSHAEGQKTIASCDYQHVQGKYNVEDSNSAYAHIVGNGESNGNRSNAHTIDWNGNGWFAGDVLVGGTSQDDASKVITESEMNTKLDEIVDQVFNSESENAQSGIALKDLVIKELVAENKNPCKFYIQDLEKGIYIFKSLWTGTAPHRIQLFAGNLNLGMMGKGSILIVTGEETIQNCKSNFKKGYIIIQQGINFSAATQHKFGTLTCTCSIGEDETVSWTYANESAYFLGTDQKISNITNDDVDISLIPTVGAIKNYVKHFSLNRYEEIDTYTVTEEGISIWDKDGLSLREFYLIVNMPTPEGSQDTLPKLGIHFSFYNRTSHELMGYTRNLGQVTEATTELRFAKLYTKLKLDNYSYEIKSFLHNFNVGTSVEIDEINLTNDDIYDTIQHIRFVCDTGKYFPVGTEITLMGAKVT